MYSNDMWEFHPENPKAYSKFPLQFWENGKIKIERVTKEHQPMLTTWYTEHAVDFIQRNKSNPFLLYVPHSMPHVPLFCSEKFKGKSGAGLYGDVMMEIDWSVGEITKALKTAGVENNTLVVFTSDNGPWISYGNHAGKTPFREAKGTGFDGGTRSACIMRYPGPHQSGLRCRSGRSARSTCCPRSRTWRGAAAPKNPIDGKNVWDLDLRQARRGEPARVLPVLHGPDLRGRDQRRRPLEAAPAARVPDAGRGGPDGAAGKYRQAKHRALPVRHGEGPVRNHQRDRQDSRRSPRG